MTIKLFAALICLGLAPAIARAQNSQIVGTWKLVGADVQPAERKKFASNDRAKGTFEEYRDAQLSTSTSFGRYTVDLANHTIAFAAIGSSYPNREGKTNVLSFTLHGDTLSWRVTPRPDGSVPITTIVRER